MFILMPDGGVDPTATGGVDVGGGTTATVRNIHIHQPDLFDQACDAFNGHSTTGHGGAAIVTTVAPMVTARTVTLAGVRRVPYVAGALAVTSVIGDIRAANNTPTSSDVVETALRRLLQEGTITQEQLDAIRRAADSSSFNRNEFRDLLLESGLLEQEANQLADAAQQNRTLQSNRNHNATVNTALTATGAVLGGLAVAGAIALAITPVGWGIGAVIVGVCIGAAVGNWIAGWFRR